MWLTINPAGCFPRTRGDGPALNGRTVKDGSFPPHARGWTAGSEEAGGLPLVSPARAGMDPRQARPAPRSHCFPRTRGDGPDDQVTTLVQEMFPPHARGWTRPIPRIVQIERVSPARAGMDRCGAFRCRSSDGFPRTRGDGPPQESTGTIVDGFPPHARGWTRGGLRRRQGVEVSPARAGMDRGCTTPTTTRRRFPRTRGDGPVTPRRTAEQRMFPPHARGWTFPSASHPYRERVSPARAGMDPLTLLRSAEGAGFPRTRGDGPFGRWLMRRSRTFPPHARGWTPSPRSRLSSYRVSPARAGMDPAHLTPAPFSGGFPRTRGDGPQRRRS